jgi:hypothetical protein
MNTTFDVEIEFADREYVCIFKDVFKSQINITLDIACRCKTTIKHICVIAHDSLADHFMSYDPKTGTHKYTIGAPLPEVDCEKIEASQWMRMVATAWCENPCQLRVIEQFVNNELIDRMYQIGVGSSTDGEVRRFFGTAGKISAMIEACTDDEDRQWMYNMFEMQ